MNVLPAPLLRLRRPLIIGAHLILIPLVYLIGFGLRFDLPIPSVRMDLYWATVPILLVVRLFAFAYFKLFEGWWRHASMQDLVDLFKAVTLSTVLLAAVLFLGGDLSGFPRSLLVLDWLAAMAVFGGARFVVRGVREQRVSRQRSGHGRRALVIGAGEAAESLLRQFRRHDSSRILPVALLDDDPLKQGMRLHGLQVVGTTEDIDAVVARHGVEVLILALPSATQDQMKRIVQRCVETGLEFKIVPPLDELVDGRVRLSQLRPVKIEDLLGRASVKLKLSMVELDLAGRTVCVTGGAGSIGSELVRQIARFAPHRVVVIDKAESSLYFIHHEIQQAYPSLDIVPVIADITNVHRLDEIFATYQPSHVFHAAAYKHVPLMEQNIVEAIRNNVLGTFGLAECAARHGVTKFVLISTDKAVRPSSVMGASKRIAERIVLGWPSLRRAGTDFRAVRFGNVLGSDGSVVPLFKRQLAAGMPLTVTHPDVTRYFMTIPEAVQLVLQASVLPEAGGRIAMLEMGEPVRIVALAENLVRLSGLEPYRDVPIVFTGLRPGEKLHEELMSEVESTVPTGIDKIRIVELDETDAPALQLGIDRLGVALTLATREDLLNAIRSLVPECVEPLRKAGWAAPRLAPLALVAAEAPPRTEQHGMNGKPARVRGQHAALKAVVRTLAAGDRGPQPDGTPQVVA